MRRSPISADNMANSRLTAQWPRHWHSRRRLPRQSPVRQNRAVPIHWPAHPATAPQQGEQTRLQFVEIKGLGQVVIGAKAGLHPVADGATGSEHNHRRTNALAACRSTSRPSSSGGVRSSTIAANGSLQADQSAVRPLVACLCRVEAAARKPSASACASAGSSSTTTSKRGLSPPDVMLAMRFSFCCVIALIAAYNPLRRTASRQCELPASNAYSSGPDRLGRTSPDWSCDRKRP